MVQNVLDIVPEVLSVLAGVFVLMLFAIAFAIPKRGGVLPGSSGKKQGPEGSPASPHSETVKPDGYIDSFGRQVSEAGGGLPVLAWIALIGIPLWWLVYLILFWSPR